MTREEKIKKGIKENLKAVWSHAKGELKCPLDTHNEVEESIDSIGYMERLLKETKDLLVEKQGLKMISSR